MYNTSKFSFKCTNCGKIVNLLDGKFCSGCGLKISSKWNDIIPIDLNNDLWSVRVNTYPDDELYGILHLGIFKGTLWDVICKVTSNQRSIYYISKYEMPDIIDITNEKNLLKCSTTVNLDIPEVIESIRTQNSGVGKEALGDFVNELTNSSDFKFKIGVYGQIIIFKE